MKNINIKDFWILTKEPTNRLSIDLIKYKYAKSDNKHNSNR